MTLLKTYFFRVILWWKDLSFPFSYASAHHPFFFSFFLVKKIRIVGICMYVGLGMPYTVYVITHLFFFVFCFERKSFLLKLFTVLWFWSLLFTLQIQMLNAQCSRVLRKKKKIHRKSQRWNWNRGKIDRLNSRHALMKSALLSPTPSYVMYIQIHNVYAPLRRNGLRPMALDIH